MADLKRNYSCESHSCELLLMSAILTEVDLKLRPVVTRWLDGITSDHSFPKFSNTFNLHGISSVVSF